MTRSSWQMQVSMATSSTGLQCLFHAILQFCTNGKRHRLGQKDCKACVPGCQPVHVTSTLPNPAGAELSCRPDPASRVSCMLGNLSSKISLAKGKAEGSTVSSLSRLEESSRGLRGGVILRVITPSQSKPSNQRCRLISFARPLSIPNRLAGLRSSNLDTKSCKGSTSSPRLLSR